MDNNLQNQMTSLFVDSINKLIYTGTWSGYIICWDYFGNQLYMMDHLTSMANSNLITGLVGNKDNSSIYNVDYNGNITKWHSPMSYIRDHLRINTECKKN